MAFSFDDLREKVTDLAQSGVATVSYTHLTLPTTTSV